METRRPLDGLRVLELAQVVAGPFCGTLMAEFGAEVIKTEMPGKGDDLRRLGPSEDGVSYWFAVDNRNKKLMTLDLRTPKGQDIVRRLVPKVDVVLENFRPGVMRRLGLNWESLNELNPRLIYCSISGYGQTGPSAERDPADRGRATPPSAPRSAAPGTSTATPIGRRRGRLRSIRTT